MNTYEFILAFVSGVAITETAAIIQNGALLEGWGALRLALAPILSAALAAGISAAWNVMLEKLKEGE